MQQDSSSSSHSHPFPSYQNPTNLYPPSQPAPLYLDAENDYGQTQHYLDSELLSRNDPDQLLRLTRSATETIHEAISEDDRRRLAKKNRSKLSLDPTRKKFSQRISTRSSTITSITTQQQAALQQQQAILGSSILNPKLSTKSSAHQLKKNHPQDHSSSTSAAAHATQKFIPPMPIAPELDQDEEDADEHTRNLKELEDSPAADLQRKQIDASKQQRRSVYVNLVLPTAQIDNYGDPIARYVRNKVRTTKYTIVTFLPKVCLKKKTRTRTRKRTNHLSPLLQLSACPQSITDIHSHLDLFSESLGTISKRREYLFLYPHHLPSLSHFRSRNTTNRHVTTRLHPLNHGAKGYI
jgi:phospholipid-translocating ATPase